MAERKRFVCTGFSWSAGAVVIPREGFETDDPAVIQFLLHHRDYGNFIRAVPTAAELTSQRKDFARGLLQEEAMPYVPVAVEPLATPDPTKELTKLQEEQAIREAQAAAENQAAEERKAKNTATREKIAAKSGKKTSPKAKG
ncbi:MAG: hypothetical protein RR051_01665 [Clostridiales bacterium]